MSSTGYMVTFGITEIIFSQIPDFDQVWWLSIVAAIMSFTYSTVGLSLGIAKVAGKRERTLPDKNMNTHFSIFKFVQS